MTTASRAAGPAGEPRVRYGMVFDLDACVGCQTCTIACKQTNQTTPGVLWRNVLDQETGAYPEVDRSFLLTGCQHCDSPPCVPVCPTGATYRRDDGLVVIDYDVCIGCSSCVVACPYQARTLEKDPPAYYAGHVMATEQRPVQLQRVGVAQKCSFCKERVDEGLARGLKPGRDPDATPACANACISQAITFGNFADAEDPVSRKLEQAGGRQMHADLGTNPHIFYIGERAAHEPKLGKLQTSWDIRAAMNFILGGMASALFVWAWLAHVLAGWASGPFRVSQFVAAALMAVGLFFVFLKLGRKLRFWRVAMRWQSSWMTRETWCVGLIFGSLGLSLVWPSAVLDALVALGAAAFLYSQARILHTSKGIVAWRHAAVPRLLVWTGMLEGAALLFLLFQLFGAPEFATQGVGVAGLASAVAMSLIWPGYLASIRQYGGQSLQSLEPALSWVGHRLPILGFLVPALGLSAAAGQVGTALSVLGALAAVGSGALMKHHLIVRCGYFMAAHIPPAASPLLRRSSAIGPATGKTDRLS